MKYSEKFRVAAGSTVDLSKIDPAYTGEYDKDDEKKAEHDLEKLQKKLNKLQEVMYAQGIYSLELVFQAMDAAGKDGTIERIAGAFNPQGNITYGIKAPTREERAEHYLDRFRRKNPKPGYSVTLSRSHYEDVLVVKVKHLVPEQVWKDAGFASEEEFFEARYNEINKYEKEELTDKNTVVLKFFLHISPEQQVKLNKLFKDMEYYHEHRNRNRHGNNKQNRGHNMRMRQMRDSVPNNN